jgi:hypothetical protein
VWGGMHGRSEHYFGSRTNRRERAAKLNKFTK